MQQIPESYKTACQAYEQRNFDVAIAKLEQTIQEDDTFAPAFYIKGLTYMQLQDWKNAFESFHRYSQFAPEKGDTYLNMGTAMLNLQRPKEALPHLDFALSLKMTENRPERVYLNKALAFKQLQDLDNAKEMLTKALELHPHFDEALLEMARTQLDTSNFEEAITYYDRLVELPQQRQGFPIWEAWVGLALSQASTNQYSKALVSMEEAIELQPKSVAFFRTHEAFKGLQEGEYAEDFETILGE